MRHLAGVSDYLTLFGVPVSVAWDTGAPSRMSVGGQRSRAQSGALRVNARAYKQALKCRTVPVSAQEAQSLEHLLDWRYDALRFLTSGSGYTDKGRPPEVFTATASSSGGRSGGKLTVASGQAAQWLQVFGVAGGTVCIGRKESGTWHDYALGYDDTMSLDYVYKDGVAQAAVQPAWMSAPGGGDLDLHLVYAAASTDYCQIQLFQTELPTSWLNDLWIWRVANALPQAPGLTVFGAWTRLALTMLGPGGGDDRSLAGALQGSSYSLDLRQVSIDLEEV